MKIGINDLDIDLVEKIRRLDSLELNYKKDNGNIVMYDGNKFYTSNMPQQIIEKTNVVNNEIIYFSSNEIEELKEHLYNSKGNFKSSFDTNMIGDPYFSTNFKNLLTTINYNVLCKTDSNILRFDEYAGFYYLYLNNGFMIKINADNPSSQTKYDFLSILKTNFACSNLRPKSILNIYPYKEGYLISTIENGVFYINIPKGIYELKFAANNVKYIQALHNDEILLVSLSTKNAINIYDFNTGNKIETYNNLSSYDLQIPQRFYFNKDRFFILGKTAGYNMSNNLLHGWRLDPAGISYENIDSDIHENKQSVDYHVKFMTVKDSYLYLSGIFNKKLFVWKYDINALYECPEEYVYEYPVISYDDFKLFKVLDNNCFYFTIKDRLVKLTFDGHVLENLQLKEYSNIERIYLTHDKLIVVDKNELLSYPLPKYSYYQTLDFDIYNEEKYCNNINILIVSENAKERAVFYNPEDGKQIMPTFYIINSDKYSLIKLKDCNYKKIKMRLNIERDSNIKGIVVNKNNLFIK